MHGTAFLSPSLISILSLTFTHTLSLSLSFGTFQATSDNVIRAGLTPKFKDVNALCSSLTYAQ